MENGQGNSREKWSSLLGFVWVATGAAVGLGNVWKFPYMVGHFGGSAFVLLYLVFVLLVAIPVMIAEIMLGKMSQRNAVDGFSFLARKHDRSPLWKYTGYLGLITLLLIFCFYSVVGGWSIAYLYLGASDTFAQKNSADIQEIWIRFLSEPSVLISCSFLFIFFTMGVVYFGIKKGLERACTFMMPGLLLLLIALVIYSVMQGNFYEAFVFMFAFQPEKIEASTIIASLGHAFFTLAIGACAMMVYGSHLPKRASVIKSVFLVAGLDITVALLSGLAIFPLIFAHDLSASQGPGLMFVTLPIVFAQVPLGWFFATLFFALLFFAALSSSLSFAEPLVDAVSGRLGFARRSSVLLIGCVTCIGSVFCALSFNIFAHVKLFAHWTIFDLFADVSTNILLPVGGIAISLFAGLVVKKNDFFSPTYKYGKIVFKLWRFLVLIVAPFAILMVLINSLYQ